jgi:hypothetical protein
VNTSLVNRSFKNGDKPIKICEMFISDALCH